MAIIRYRPRDMIDEMSRLFERNWGAPMLADDESSAATVGWQPAVDVKEEDKQFVITADIPGVDPEDIEVHMENGMLTIQGERETKEEKKEDKGFSRVERSYGKFYRRFSLPDTADAESISAKGKHGVLEIQIPKRSASTARKIQVKGE